jgi:type IV fimbrial biogenesis protein FimT
MDRKVKGYSLIEILVIIAILAILAWIAVGPLRTQIMKARLHEAVNKFVADLNEMKRRSITQEDSFGIEIQNNNTSYVTFRDVDRDCTRDSGETIATVNLPGGVSISTPNATRTIIWTRKGVPLNGSCGFFSGTITFTALTFSKDVIIGRLGRIRID